ncbi:MAG: glycosyltransferase [Anaerolineales bacterium]|nr:glycosyltransferase [Anaerolineales bacterium]
MRVLHISHRFLPRFFAGTEVYAAALARAQHARGYAVQVFAGDSDAHTPETYVWEGLPVQTMPWGWGGRADPVRTFLAGFGNPAAERRFAAALTEFRPDVVHVHHLLGLSPRLPELARAAGARVVITLHDFWFKCSNTWLYRYDEQVCPGPGTGYHCGGCALQRLGRPPQPALMAAAAPLFWARTARLRRALRAAHRVIAPSRAVAEAFADAGLAPGQLVILPHGLSEDVVPAAAPPAPERRGVRFIFIGSLIRPKGAHIAVAAFAGLGQPGAELWIYGDLDADPAYTAEVRALAAPPGVVLGGRLARADVPAALRAADVFLLPALWREAHSIVVDEAWAAGRPVLVSAHTAAAERVLPEVNGLLAPPGDIAAWRAQMRRLGEEPGLLARLRAGVTAPKTLAAHVAEIERLYRQGVVSNG